MFIVNLGKLYTKKVGEVNNKTIIVILKCKLLIKMSSQRRLGSSETMDPPPMAEGWKSSTIYARYLPLGLQMKVVVKEGGQHERVRKVITYGMGV